MHVHKQACDCAPCFTIATFGGLAPRIRDRREEGELPCRYLQGGREYSSWFIGDVNPWQRRVRGECKGKTDCKNEIGKKRRATGVRERNGRSTDEGRKTGNLLPEDLLPLCTRYRKRPLWGPTGEKVHDCPANILLKCRRMRIHEKERCESWQEMKKHVFYMYQTCGNSCLESAIRALDRKIFQLEWEHNNT